MSIGHNSRLVAIVDDDESVQLALRDLIESDGLPALSGLELQAMLKAERCPIPIIFITAHGDAEMRIHAMREGAVEFLSKPFDDTVLLEIVHAALRRSGND
jgi:FixJ family two-component response regulator